MAYYIVQSGTTLKKVSAAGTVTALTLPTTVTINSAFRARTAVLGNMCVVVNAPNANLSVDPFNVVRLLAPRAPTAPCTLSASTAAGVLNGKYKVKYTYAIRDDFGNILAESGFSPESAESTPLAAKMLVASNIGISAQAGVTCRILYRTTSGPGGTYYRWVILDGNVLTTTTDNASDISLQNIAADTDLGTPPNLYLVATWQNRLWGAAVADPDALLYSGNGRIYAWNATQSIPIPPPRLDHIGLTAIISRRDELGVSKRNSFHVVRGTDETNFTRYTVAEGIGVWATDSVVVIRDIAYFLGNPFGIYTWGSNGLDNVSDEKVKSWFASDTYFNRANFLNAVGGFDPILNAYILLLSAPGQTTLTKYIQYNLTDKTWWGPHSTADFTPTYVTTLLDTNDVGFLSLGSSGGKLYAPQSTKTDGTATAIDFDVSTGHLTGNTPTVNKLWGRPSIVTQIETSAGVLDFYTTRNRNGREEAPRFHSLATGEEDMARIGVGNSVKLRFRQNTAGKNVVIYGVELPFAELGERSIPK
jgi:hypothetical protein